MVRRRLPANASPAARAVRRSLVSASYLEWSAAPFAGAVHDLGKPLADRLKSREHVGPYYWQPAAPGGERGFYAASRGLACDPHGSTFRLRLEPANDHLPSYSRTGRVNGYFYNEHGETLEPIIARLPHGRGFLAGHTMGAGMASALSLSIYADAESAAYAAHSEAESAAERQREFEEAESAELENA